jgi:hypothetical protein
MSHSIHDDTLSRADLGSLMAGDRISVTEEIAHAVGVATGRA